MSYVKKDGSKTQFKSIRLTEGELKNWSTKKIHIFLNNKNKSNGDELILKKIIPAFVNNNIKINLEKHEIDRIKELWSEINNE